VVVAVAVTVEVQQRHWEGRTVSGRAVESADWISIKLTSKFRRLLGSVEL
jgi:hypothetical protein